MQPRHDKLPQRLTDDSEEEGGGQENHCETYGAGQRVVLAVRDNREVADIYSTYSSSNSTRQPSGWVVRLLAVLSLVLLINIVLLLVTRRRSSATADSSSSGSAAQQQQARISERLNNATIPNWKPLPDPSQILTRIAFGSCLSQEMPQPVWDTLLAQQEEGTAAPAPDLVLLMGDNVYGDCAHDDCFLLRQAYRNWANHASLQGAASQLAIYATLDDHDYGMADCTATNPHKEIARQLFAEFFDLSNLPVDGVYRAAAWGPLGQRLQVILLDTRFSRSPFFATQDPTSPYRPVNDTVDGYQEPPQQRMLSELQWTWLEQQLNEPADLRLVVSSVQALNQVTGFEAWRHLPREQTRLIRLLQDKRAILLSGDRHVGGFYEFDGLMEVTSSSMTHTIPLQSEFCNGTVPADCDEVDASRVGDWVRQNHYGMVDIDWDQQMVRLSLRRTESSYGSSYSPEVQEFYRDHHGKFSDAGQILASREYAFADL